MMFRLLLKKQLYEIFRSYFYDSRRNRMRSKGSVAGMFILFGVMISFITAMFFGLSASLCLPLCSAGLGWLYFCVIGGVALFIGVFGSAFNTYNMLYSSKDNDLLLSMPIPAKAIIGSRVTCVYLLGLLYSGIVIVPAYAVYFFTAGNPWGILGAFAFTAVVTVVTACVSCLLGWVIAKIAGKLKNKSIITVIIAIAFFAAYYVVYFRIQEIIGALIENAAEWGEKIRGSAYAIYLFGRLGEGDPLACAVFVCGTALVAFLIFTLLKKTFFNIAGATPAVKKTVYREKPVKVSGQDSALFRRELGRFLSSPLYMLNCGLPALLLPVAGALMLWRGRSAFTALTEVAGLSSGFAAVAVCTAICFVSVMGNGIAAVSVSLEGKNLWIIKSLPVAPKKALDAKLRLDFSVYIVPLIFAGVCAAVSVDAGPVCRVLVALVPVLFHVLTTFGGLLIGLKLPELNWTNEAIPLKQSRCVTICTFAGMGAALTVGLPFLIAGIFIDAAVYLGIVAAMLAAGSAVCYRCLLKYGTKMFEDL